MTRVLVVEDEPALARALAITLRANRYDVAVAHSGASGLDGMANWHPDLVVLDLGLPDLDGMDVLAPAGLVAGPRRRASARQTSDDKVEALDAGADDYVTKPFAWTSCWARIRAAARRRRPTTRPRRRDRRVHRRRGAPARDADGHDVRLTPTEWHMLEILARNVGKVVGRRELLAELRGPNLDRETHYLRVYLAQLRRKLEPDPAHPVT